MIKLSKEIRDAIYEQGQNELPNEACGYLAGKDGVVVKRIQMTNVDKSPEHFTLDPKEQFAAVKEARSEGLKLIAVYHTHPETPARPSVEDIKLAFDPTISYIITSMIDGDIKSFKIKSGLVDKEEIEVV